MGLARTLHQAIKTSTTAAQILTNWLAQTKPAVNLGSVLTAIIGKTTPALAVSQSPLTLVVAETPALSLSMTPSAITIPETPAINAGTVAQLTLPTTPAGNLAATGNVRMPEVPAGKIVQISIALNRVDPINAGTATQDTGGNWTNLAQAEGAPNAVDGTPPTNVAALDGTTLAVSGNLRGTYAAQPNRPSSLIIDRVDMDFYIKGKGQLGSSFIVGFRINTPVPGADNQLEALSGNTTFNYLAAPRSYRLDNGAGAFIDAIGTAVTWANIAILGSWVNASILANQTNVHYYVDAVILRVTAHETWNP